MKILFLSLRYPYPAYSGEKVVALSYLKAFADLGHSVDLLAIDDKRSYSREEVQQLKDHIPALRSINIVSFSKLRGMLGAVAGWLAGLPLQVGFFSDYLLKRCVESRLKSGEYDRILVQTVRLVELVPKDYREKSIVLYSDSIAMNYQLSMDFVSPVRKSVFKIEWRRLKKYEILNASMFRKVILHSFVDQDYLNNPPRSVVVPITKERSVKYCLPDRDCKVFVFIGRYSYFPNLDAVLSLIRMAPQLHSLGLRIDLIGPELPENIQNIIRQLPAIRYLGVVEDLSCYLDESLGVLCPIRLGGGMQNKILDALSVGRPAVTTRFCAEPYRRYLADGNAESIGILSYDNEDEMLNILSRLSVDSEFHEDMCKRAYEGSAIFGYESLKAKLSALLN